jgi:hypothetical protein
MCFETPQIGFLGRNSLGALDLLLSFILLSDLFLFVTVLNSPVPLLFSFFFFFIAVSPARNVLFFFFCVPLYLWRDLSAQWRKRRDLLLRKQVHGPFSFVYSYKSVYSSFLRPLSPSTNHTICSEFLSHSPPTYCSLPPIQTTLTYVFTLSDMPLSRSAWRRDNCFAVWSVPWLK